MIYFLILLGLLNCLTSLKYYFSQDDFIHLYSSHASNLLEFFNFFNPLAHFPDIFFYRPLATQVYFYFNQSIFGLNPMVFHLESLVFHGINGYLFYLIVKKIWRRKEVAVLASFFYVISAVHFLSLYYISSFQQILRTFFMFWSILEFIEYHQTKRFKALFLSLLTFIGALLSKETSVILPLLFFPIVGLQQNLSFAETFRKILKSTIPFWGILIIYLLIRVIGFQTIFSQGEYSINAAPFNILQNLKWYLLWSSGLPEILDTYPSLKPASWIHFMNDFQYAQGVVVSFIILALSLLGLILKQGRTIFQVNKATIYILELFFIPLLPVIILNGHKYPQYLDVSFLALLPVLSILCLPIKFKPGFKILLIGSFIILQIMSVRLSENTHWATHRAEVAQFYYQDLKEHFPSQHQPSEVSFVGEDYKLKEVSVAIARDYALKVWYPNQVTRVEYVNKLNQSNFNDLIIPVTRY